MNKVNNFSSKSSAFDFGKVAVLMGGISAEREISIQTGNAVHAALCRRGIDAHFVDTHDYSLFRLVDESFDRVFIALHGRGGEDGEIQGTLQSFGIPYTGSGILGSALAMDKVRSKLIWRSLGLMTPDFIEIKKEEDLDRVSQQLSFPIMVKPTHEGSSYGASKVISEEGLYPAWEEANKLDDSVLIEAWVDGLEYTAAILGREVLPILRLETPREFYDYQAKYLDDSTTFVYPCGLEDDQKREISKLLLMAFESICASGWGRADFIIDKEGIVWLIEINTVPGMTSHSLVPMSAGYVGIEFDDLVFKILETSMTHDGSIRKPIS